MGNLTNIAIKNAAPGRYQDGGGLMIEIKEGGAGKWIYRYSFAKKRRDMGLGAWPAVSLAEARKSRDQWAAVLRSGRDPVSVRSAQKAEAKAALDRQDPTFKEMAETTFESRKGRLRGDGERGRWFSPLRLHVIPKIGAKRMSEIHQADIKAALAPIWRKKYPTAEKAIQRTRIVFETAKLTGVACDPLTVDAAMHMLGEVHHETVNLSSAPWREVPGIYAAIPDTVPGLCLRWSILTAVRPDASRGARFSEIERDTWTVPADRVKGMRGKVEPFRVPLSGEALSVADRAAQFSNNFLFPGQRSGTVSDVAVTKALRLLHPTATVHGFRASCRTWMEDVDACSYDVAESILGHVVGGKVERTYQRSDRLDRRRPVMEAWARFVTGQESDEVVPIRR